LTRKYLFTSRFSSGTLFPGRPAGGAAQPVYGPAAAGTCAAAGLAPPQRAGGEEAQRRRRRRGGGLLQRDTVQPLSDKAVVCLIEIAIVVKKIFVE